MARSWRVCAWVVPTLIGLSLSAGCGSKRVAPAAAPMPPPVPTLIVLLPDPETKVTGRIHVSNEFGGIDLGDPEVVRRGDGDRRARTRHHAHRR